MGRSDAPIGQGRAGHGGAPVAPSQRPRIGASVRELVGGVRRFARRRRGLITVVGSLATAAALAWALSGRRQEFADALSAGRVVGARRGGAVADRGARLPQ